MLSLVNVSLLSAFARDRRNPQLPKPKASPSKKVRKRASPVELPACVELLKSFGSSRWSGASCLVDFFYYFWWLAHSHKMALLDFVLFPLSPKLGSRVHIVSRILSFRSIYRERASSASKSKGIVWTYGQDLDQTTDAKKRKKEHTRF